MNVIKCILLFVLVTQIYAVSTPGFGTAQYVLVIGASGLGSQYFNSSTHPNIDTLMSNGAYSLEARDTLPTDSKPNWAAVLSGGGVEETGVDSDEWYYPRNCINYGVIDEKCLLCETCSIVVPIAQDLFNSNPSVYNTTINVIEKFLHKICDTLSFPLKATCNTAVDLFTEKIFNAILLNQTSIALCDEVQACREELSATPGEGVLFPTIFKMLKFWNPLLKTALYTDTDVVVSFMEPHVIDYFLYAEANSTFLIDQFQSVLENDKPQLVFFHFDDIHQAALTYGYGSSNYLAAIQQVDTKIGTLLNFYQDAGIYSQTLVLLTSDHGGTGSVDGNINLDSIEIPWIVSGPGVQASHEIEGYVRDMDIAPTAAWALGMQQNSWWVGKPILECWTGAPQPPLTPPPPQITPNVVVLVISGLTNDGLEHAHTPILDEIVNNGASTMSARAVIPATTGTNLASIFVGAGPEESGICEGSIEGVPCTWNIPPAPSAIPPISNSLYFPSIFDVLKNSNRGFFSGAFYNWPNATSTFNSSNINYQYQNSTDEGVALGVSYFFTHHPNFTMIQFNDVQTAASSHGYNSSQYYTAIETADKNLEIIYNSLLVTMPDSILIITSDHGGSKEKDGLITDECIIVPWIIFGPSIRYALQIEQYVRVFDTAAISTWALGVPTAPEWIGNPLLPVFSTNTF